MAIISNMFHAVVLKIGSKRPWYFRCSIDGQLVNNQQNIMLKECLSFALDGFAEDERIRIKISEGGGIRLF